jgi:hypothetical protein
MPATAPPEFALEAFAAPNGMCNIAIVKQVELEFLERLEDKFVDGRHRPR